MLVWSVGEVLWDIFPDAERFGGAPLNICVNLQRLGHHAMLLSAVGDDARGRLALELMKDQGLSTDGITTIPGASTGTARVTLAADGEPTFHIPRPAAFDCLSVEGVPELPAEKVDWLYFGTLCQTQEHLESFTTELAHRLDAVRCFYDMNLRAGQWNLPLVQRLSALTTILKLNEEEARLLFVLTSGEGVPFLLERFCELWASTYNIETVCVTLGRRGCMVYSHGMIYQAGGYSVVVADTVGSGDAFAAAFLHANSRGWPVLSAARFANAAGALVASRPGATPAWETSEILAISGLVEASES